MPSITLPSVRPEGDDQELWRQTLEALAQMKAEIEANASQIGRR